MNNIDIGPKFSIIKTGRKFSGFYSLLRHFEPKVVFFLKTSVIFVQMPDVKESHIS